MVIQLFSYEDEETFILSGLRRIELLMLEVGDVALERSGENMDRPVWFGDDSLAVNAFGKG